MDPDHPPWTAIFCCLLTSLGLERTSNVVVLFGFTICKFIMNLKQSTIGINLEGLLHYQSFMLFQSGILVKASKSWEFGSFE
jgi:hypothetical protein